MRVPFFIYNSGVTFFTLIMLIFGLSCNMVSDSFNTHGIFFDPHENSNSPKDELMYLFNVFPGDTCDFSGTCTLTVSRLVQGDTTTTMTIDSSYARISSYPDTIIFRNDSLYGAPTFTLDDINNWEIVKYYIAAPDSFLFGEILRAYLSTGDFQNIASIADTNTELSSKQKEAVIAACNSMISIPEFYSQYREKIWATQSDTNAIPLLIKLVNDGIFLDTSGTVNSGLTVYKLTVLQWFNVTILQQFIDIGVNIPRENYALVRFLNTSLKAHKVYPIRFQMGKVQNSFEQSITRYVGMNPDELIQLAYRDAAGMVFPQDTKIADYIFSRGDHWQVTPLVFSRVSFLPEISINTLIALSRAVILQNKELSNDSLSVFDCKLYYPLVGTTLENGTYVPITGKISVVFSFIYNENNTVTRTAHITHWTTTIHLYKTYSNNNNITFHQKTCLVTRE